jgi:hypothetical protein
MRKNHPLSRLLLPMLLAASMLLAQWGGQQHRVAHGWTGFWHEQDNAPRGSGDKSLHHSCLILDAQILADRLATAAFVLPVPDKAAMPQSDAPIVSWRMPFTAHFLSRAPPPITDADFITPSRRKRLDPVHPTLS